MSSGPLNAPRPTKNQRREAAREKARALREAQRKRERRNKVFIQGGIIVASLAIIAVIALIITNSIRPEGPGPRNMASDGLLYTTGMEVVSTPALAAGEAPTPSEPDESGTIANIVSYVDFLCPFCGDFEKTNGEQIEKMVESGAATVEVHPLSILNSQSSGTQYPLRAANAFACVADSSPQQAYDFAQLLFENQPPEGSAGLTDEELTSYASEADVSSLATIESCIDDAQFADWVQAATDRALKGPVPNSDLEMIQGTPTVLVNGKAYTGSLDDPAEFSSFVLQATSETYSTSTSTPEPPASPEPPATPEATTSPEATASPDTQAPEPTDTPTPSS